MANFSDLLKKWFYNNGSRKAGDGVQVCLLDSSGNPIGSDSIERISNYINTKDDVVDMGLPSGTLWAKKNIGAVTPEDYGMYFSWGNLNAHDVGAYDFSDATYQSTPAASIDGNLNLSQDAARANLGGAWKMPTKEQFAELFNDTYTTNTWTTQNGVYGRLVTSKVNGNTLFFPAAGFCDGTSRYYVGSYGYCWSSSFYSSASAYLLYFDSGGVYPQYYYPRYNGFSVRAVQ